MTGRQERIQAHWVPSPEEDNDAEREWQRESEHADGEHEVKCVDCPLCEQS